MMVLQRKKEESPWGCVGSHEDRKMWKKKGAIGTLYRPITKKGKNHQFRRGMPVKKEGGPPNARGGIMVRHTKEY